MPGIDSYEVCRAIRSDVLCPILFLSARQSETEKVWGYDAEGDSSTVVERIKIIRSKFAAIAPKKNIRLIFMKNRFLMLKLIFVLKMQICCYNPVNPE